MIPSIDFLPIEYRQARKLRQKRLWQRGVAVALVVLLALGVVGQRQRRATLVANRDRLRDQSAKMLTQLGAPDALRRQIQTSELRANLVSRLRVRPAPTRLLAAVANSRPPSVSLTSLRLTTEPLHSRRSNSETPAIASVPAPDANRQKPPEVKDLDQLRTQDEKQGLFLLLDGLAADDVSVSQYLARLEQTGLFDDLHLIYTDRYRHGDTDLRRFAIRVQVRRVQAVPIVSQDPEARG